MYDGDGNRVSETINGVTTYYIGNYYEYDATHSVATKYYYAGTQRVAMQTNGTLYYFLSDQLGSTSLTLDANGNVISELRYTAWGQVRYQAGTTPTNYTFTGQYSYTADFGLMFYNARWYDSSLGRFAQADSIVPGGVQGYDRYAYVNNSPVSYADPSGHMIISACGHDGSDCGGDDPKADKLLAPYQPHGKDGEHHGCVGNGVCDTAITGLQIVAGALDFLQVFVGFGELMIGDVPVLIGIGMAVAAPLSAPATLAGALGMDAEIAGTFGPVENGLSVASLLMTAGADLLAGNTYIGQNGDMYIGKSTLTSVGTTVVGAIPEVNIDFVSNMYQLHADSEGLGGSVNVSQEVRDLTFIPAYHMRVPARGQR